MPTLSLSEYVQLERQHVHWLIPQVLPKPGLFLLLGPPKIGKSRLALQIGLSVAQRTPFIGHIPETQGRVLYLQLDTSELVWRDMLLKVQAKGVGLNGPIYAIHPDNLPRSGDLENPLTRETLRKVVEDTGPDLVVLDVLRELHTEDENDSGAMKRVVDRIMELFGHTSVLLIHHSRKLDPRYETNVSPVLASRGSTYLTGRADGFFYLTHKRLVIVSRFCEERVYDAELGEQGVWVFHTPHTQLVHELCAQNPTLSHGAIYSEHQTYLTQIGISKATYYRVVGRGTCPHVRPHGVESPS